MDERLATFLDHARGKGMDLATIRQLLAAQGWKDKDIAAAFAARELDLPVPTPTGTSSARETFLYLVAFVALYTWVGSLIALVFTFINLQFPDVAEPYRAYRLEWALSAIRQAIAAILVAFPLFLIVWRTLLREVEAHAEKAHSRVRLGLIYVSLFVAAVTIVADVITLIYYLLEGELSTRFILKVVALFLITATGFIYFALNLRDTEGAA